MAQELFGDSSRSSLDRLAAAVRSVHKALIDSTRRDYERVHGRIESPYALFTLVANDPAFAWLQPMTRLIVDIEDRLGPKAPPVTKDDVDRARRSVSTLIGTGEFSADYHARVQKDPDVAVEQGRLHALLRTSLRP